MTKPEIPASPDTERALLGGILLYNAAWPQLKTVTSEDFTLDSHRRIFRCMAELFGSNRAVDLVTLTEELLQHEQLETIGGASYISSLTNGLPKLESLKDYVHIIKHYSRKRRKIVQAQNALKTALDEREIPSNGHEQGEFYVGEDGVYTIVKPKDGGKYNLKICSPLTVAAITRNENGDEWGRLLEWKDLDERKHSWAMPMEIMSGEGEQFRRVLLGGGLEITPHAVAKQKLAEYVQTARPEQRAVSVSKVGWHGDVFVLPNETIGESDELCFFQSATDAEHYIRVRGTAAEWREKVGTFCAGNSRLILAVCCAFAAPLLTLTDSEAGGFHFYGRSSTGKSTALITAGSVWGGGKKNGYVDSWRNTANGLESFAEIHNEGLGCLDELAEMDPRIVAESLYMLANGQGKGRMTKNITARRRLTWTLLFLSSGEITLNEHAESGGRTVKTGVEIRLVNIAADAGKVLRIPGRDPKPLGVFEDLHGFEKPEALAHHLVDNATRIYGAPIREYLKWVAAHRTATEQRAREFRDGFLSNNLPPEVPGEVRRAARRFALAAFSGELASEIGLTGWKRNEASKGVAQCLGVWLATRDPTDADLAIRQVRQFIELHGASRFAPADPKLNFEGQVIAEKIINRAGFKRISDEDGETIEYLFLPEVFRTEVCKGFDHRMVARGLADKKYLLAVDGHLQKQYRIKDFGKSWFYVVNDSILG